MGQEALIVRVVRTSVSQLFSPPRPMTGDFGSTFKGVNRTRMVSAKNDYVLLFSLLAVGLPLSGARIPTIHSSAHGDLQGDDQGCGYWISLKL